MLLDLPDFDSVEEDHRLEVDRLLELLRDPFTERPGMVATRAESADMLRAMSSAMGSPRPICVSCGDRKMASL